MIITAIEIYKMIIPRNAPLRVAIGEIAGAENIILKIVTDEGVAGWGEASPCAYITGDSLKTNLATAQDLALLIKGKNSLAIEDRMNEINLYTVGEPSIRSAFDMALYDILGKAAGLPLYQLFGGGRRELRTDLTIGHQDTVAATITEAEKILARNFDAIKLKVGRPGREDLPHVAALRETAGPDIHIRIDANQGWDLPTAIANLRAMEGLGLQYAEQPLKAWDYEGFLRLRAKAAQPICADESVFTDKDAFKLTSMGAVDYLNIKLGKSGGLHMGLKINAIAEAVGVKCMIGCFGESRLGLTAAAHFAMARPNIVFLDLDSADDNKEDPVIGGVTYDDRVGGLMHLSDEPGLGAEIDDAFLKTCERVVV